MRIALIDADVTAFASAVVVEKATNWGDGIWTVHADEYEARAIFMDAIHRIQERVNADSVILAFSDSDNWRKAVLPTYKSNRSKVRPPILRRALAEWAPDEFKCVTRPGLEGDDVLGIMATMSTRRASDEYVICTIDKDLKTIPGQHYNTKQDLLFSVTEEEADRWHLLQTLMGDSTDGYEGCPGVGAEGAREFIESPFIWTPYEHTILRGARKGQAETRYEKQPLDGSSLWDGVVSHFEKAGLSEEHALTQARVARICRASDYDFKTRKVKLWNPPNFAQATK